jgi:WD40 repeat protein
MAPPWYDALHGRATRAYDLDLADGGFGLVWSGFGAKRGVAIASISDGQNSESKALSFALDGPLAVRALPQPTLFSMSAPMFPDGEHVAIALADGSGVAIVALASGERRGMLESGGESVAISPDGKLVAAVGDTSITIWSVADRAVRAKVSVAGGHLTSVAWHPAGHSIATTAQDDGIRWWLVDKLLAGGARAVEPDASFPRDGMTYAACFSADGSLLAAGHGDGAATLVDFEACAVRATLKQHDAEVMALAFHPTEPHLVTGSADRRVCIWHTVTGTLLDTIAAPERVRGGDDDDDEDEDDEDFDEDLDPRAVFALEFTRDGAFAITRAHGISVWRQPAKTAVKPTPKLTSTPRRTPKTKASPRAKPKPKPKTKTKTKRDR